MDRNHSGGIDFQSFEYFSDIGLVETLSSINSPYGTAVPGRKSSVGTGGGTI